MRQDALALRYETAQAIARAAGRLALDRRAATPLEVEAKGRHDFVTAVDRAVATMIGRADLRIEAFGEVGLGEDTVETIATSPGVATAAPTFERRTYLGLDLFGPGDDAPLPCS